MMSGTQQQQHGGKELLLAWKRLGCSGPAAQACVLRGGGPAPPAGHAAAHPAPGWSRCCAARWRAAPRSWTGRRARRPWPGLTGTLRRWTAAAGRGPGRGRRRGWCGRGAGPGGSTAAAPQRCKHLATAEGSPWPPLHSWSLRNCGVCPRLPHSPRIKGAEMQEGACLHDAGKHGNWAALPVLLPGGGSWGGEPPEPSRPGHQQRLVHWRGPAGRQAGRQAGRPGRGSGWSTRLEQPPAASPGRVLEQQAQFAGGSHHPAVGLPARLTSAIICGS